MTTATPSPDSSSTNRRDRDLVITWRAALKQGQATWDDTQRATFVDVLTLHPRLVLRGATATSRQTLGRALGERGDPVWAMRVLDGCPEAAIDLVAGALHAHRVELAWEVLQDPRAHAAWAVLDDEHLAARWAKGIAYNGGFERFKAWATHAPASLHHALHRPRGASHLANQAIAQRNAPLLDALLTLGLPWDGVTAAPGRPGSTLVHDLAYSGWDDGLRLLVAHRPEVDLNARNDAGRTALMHAIKHQRWGIAQALLDAGVDVHAIDISGKQALWYATAGQKPPFTPALRALVQTILLAGADPYRSEGKTSKAGSVNDWMVVYRPKAWQMQLVRRDTTLLTQAIDDARPSTDHDPLDVAPRSRARL